MSLTSLASLCAGQLTGTRQLKLACGLTEFPRDIFALADSLEVLDLSGNQLSQLPDDLPRLKRLRILFCSDNQFCELPAVLGRCSALSMVGFKANQIRSVPSAALAPSLRWLILTDNQIPSLPASIGQCRHLQKLMLAGNQLTALPPELAQCQQLALLRIAANQFTALPDWLLDLPRLAWLACAGNPMNTPAANRAPDFSDSDNNNSISDIDWSSLHLTHALGEGASGVIHAAEWQRQGRGLPVAIKLFKGAVTSDGLPDDEMTAALHAGPHPHLMGALGRLTGHPDGRLGIVMARVALQFQPLAAPPSLASCTRDVYADGTAFSLAAVLGIAHSMASAAHHLHSRQLMHGDLYAHNILVHGAHAVLGDFGAASFKPDPAQADRLQRIEVRAFGCLLQELLAHSTDAHASQAGFALAALCTDCLNQAVSARPLFTTIARTLAKLRQPI
jgi:hypothetical protein